MEAQAQEHTVWVKDNSWQAIERQLDYWAEMDREYWRQRKEKEYAAWFERTYGMKPLAKWPGIYIRS